MSGNAKMCGEVRLRLTEFWDLPVTVGRSCFYTVECGNDCFFRSGCFQTEQLEGYETPVAVATVRTKEDAIDPSILAGLDWRDKPGTIRFFLRGRVSQAVRMQVWMLARDVMPWSSDSCGHGVLEVDDVFRGIPVGSVRVSRAAFSADSLRLSKGEYAGWLAMYPQGCVYLRLLQRRKVGAMELLSMNLLGMASPSTVKLNSTRSSDGLTRQVTRSGSAHMLKTGHPTVASASAWRDVLSTGHTAESIDFLIDRVVFLDKALAEPLVKRLWLQRILPCSAVRILGLAVAVASVCLFRECATAEQLLKGLGAFLVLMLSVAAVFPVSQSELRRFSGLEVENAEYGAVIAERKPLRQMAKAWAVATQTGDSAREGLAMSVLILVAVALQTLLDLTRILRSPRTVWRAALVATALLALPFAFPKIWRVGVRVLFFLAVGSLTSRSELLQRVLANCLGVTLVVTGRQRQSVMAPLQWVTRNIPKGWELADLEQNEDEFELFDRHDEHMFRQSPRGSS